MRTIKLFLLFAICASTHAADVLVNRPSYAWAYTNLLANTNLFDGLAGQALVFDENGALIPGNVSAVFEGDVPDPLSITNLTVLESFVAATQTVSTANITKLVVSDATGLGGTPLDVRWFGAVADDSTNDWTALNKAATAAQATGRPLYIPAGTFNITQGTAFFDVTGSLTVVGDGPSSKLVHNGLGASTTFFLFSTGTNLTLRGLHLQSARFNISIPDGGISGLGITVDDVTMSDTQYGFFSVQTADNVQDFGDYIHVSNWRYFASTNTSLTRHAFWIRNAPFKHIVIDSSYIYGGNKAIGIGYSTTPLTVNPWKWNSPVRVSKTWIGGQYAPAADIHGMELLSVAFDVDACTFSQGAYDDGGSAQAAIYVYGGAGTIRNCTFDRWGNEPDKPPTIAVKGASLAVDQYNTNSVLGEYNISPGHGVQLINNVFIDDPDARTYCGGVQFDTDGGTVRGNRWYYPYGITKLIDLSPSSPVNEQGWFNVDENWFVRGTNVTQYFYPHSGFGTNAYENVTFNGNKFYHCSSSGTHYGIDVAFPTFNYRVENNWVENCPNFTLARFSSSTNTRWHHGFTFKNNYMTNASIGLVGSAPPEGWDISGAWTNAVVTGNQFWNVTTPIYLTAYLTIVDSVIADNWSVGHTANYFPRYLSTVTNRNTAIYNQRGEVKWPLTSVLPYTPESALSAYPGSLVLSTNGVASLKASGSGNTGWLNLGKFHGVTTSTPTLGVGAGDSFISNSVFYIYNGTVWRGISIDE